MSSIDKLFSVGDYRFTRLWHCFGNHLHQCSYENAVKLLDASKSNVLPINTHDLSLDSGVDGLQLGYSGISYDLIQSLIHERSLVPMLNINLQTSADDAIEKTILANSLTGIKLIKLEVLNKDDINISNQHELVKAVKKLNEIRSDLVIIPLSACDVAIATELLQLGCPALRIMGSPIGSLAGMTDMKGLRTICEFNVPIIADGGIGSAKHAHDAMKAGTDGFLINSMLFSDGQDDPASKMSVFRNEYADLMQNELTT